MNNDNDDDDDDIVAAYVCACNAHAQFHHHLKSSRDVRNSPNMNINYMWDYNLQL